MKVGETTVSCGLAHHRVPFDRDGRHTATDISVATATPLLFDLINPLFPFRQQPTCSTDLVLWRTNGLISVRLRTMCPLLLR